ncbi:uncharacterized protein LOC131306763 [Rhododendron vialii]|uniref:uncharacterized protein LOC131306763 n=1 Tax=Rhododendron vialii TaxID=182163 RepID=UPI00265E0C54|nr:uncharacterized protein LOC131306763 [Rhododendron vialii]
MLARELEQQATEGETLGPELIQQTADGVRLIRERLKIVQSRQKSYANKRRRDLEIAVGDFVFIRVSPWKGVIHFQKKGKLAPRYIGPYEIVGRVGVTAYCLALPVESARLHMFHVSMLQKFMGDPSLIMGSKPLELSEDLSYEETLVEILDRKEKVLCSKVIPYVKVLWQNHKVEEATWEGEELMKQSIRICFSQMMEV